VKKIPVLLTSSVVPADLDVKLADPEQRLFHTLESVTKWLHFSNLVSLVICDGSGFDFSDVIKEKFPGVDIECLSFSNNKGVVAQRGKGYGEGEIVRYAIDNSVFIRRSGSFAKCTGKLWVENFNDCVGEWNGIFMGKAYFENVFSLKKTRLAYFDTRFYIADVDFYRRFFVDAHQGVGGSDRRSIEDCFKEIVVRNQMRHVFFKAPPVICGVGGGAGSYYKNGKIRRLKERLRAYLVVRNSVYKDFF
jgi:hypothetical protein